MDSDKRKFERFVVQLPLKYSGDLVEAEGTVVNLSMGGCAIDGTRRVQPGAYLFLRIQLPSEEAPVKIELAPVRWVRGRIFGVEFIRQSGEDQERLKKFIGRLRLTSPG